MAYQVLARKWRPRFFAEMAGQEHVLRALINALDAGRLHHAFLFTGTRGVGKTTLARILAKSLNCEEGISSRPCGVCSSCREIDEGRFVDLIEVDAASRTKVEDTRELLDNVQYMPTRGRFKVYLIDEVHMFSNSSFNALLKTLEEPPSHVKFLLATTDPQRLPVTVLSRCLQFNLRRLPLKIIRDHLAHILEAEEILAEEAALQALAYAADGSMRDGLSLLDQAIAYGAGRVLEVDVHAILGTLPRDRVFALLEALAINNASSVLNTVADLAQQTPDWTDLLGECIKILQRIALAQYLPAAIEDEFGDRQRILTLSQQMTPEDVQLYYQIGLLGRRDLPLSPQLRGGFEMILLRMLAFRPVQEETVSVTTKQAIDAPSSRIPHIPPADTTSPVVHNPVPNQGLKKPLSEIEWSSYVHSLNLSGLDRELAMHSSLKKVEGNTLYLVLDNKKGFLLQKDRERRLEQAIQTIQGHEIKVVYSVQALASPSHAVITGDTPAKIQERKQLDTYEAARIALEKDPIVQALKNIGTLVPETIRPVSPPDKIH